MGLREWLCKRTPQRGDDTRRLIAESERTRAELQSLAGRLGVYIDYLSTKVQREMRQHNEGTGP